MTLRRTVPEARQRRYLSTGIQAPTGKIILATKGRGGGGGADHTASVPDLPYDKLCVISCTAMALPTIPGVVRCAVRGKVSSGAYWVNVHHMRYAGGASSPGSVEIAAMDTLLTRLYTGTAFGAGAAWFTMCPAVTTLEQIDYVILDGTSLGATISHTGAGSAGATVPPECAAVLTLLTGKRGRRNRGRVYLPAFQLSQLDTNGALPVTPRNSIQAQYTGMITQLQAIQWAPVVASYGKGQHTDPITKVVTPTSWAPYATDVTSVRCDALVDVQRSRKTG